MVALEYLDPQRGPLHEGVHLGEVEGCIRGFLLLYIDTCEVNHREGISLLGDLYRLLQHRDRLLEGVLLHERLTVVVDRIHTPIPGMVEDVEVSISIPVIACSVIHCCTTLPHGAIVGILVEEAIHHRQTEETDSLLLVEVGEAEDIDDIVRRELLDLLTDSDGGVRQLHALVDPRQKLLVDHGALILRQRQDQCLRLLVSGKGGEDTGLLPEHHGALEAVGVALQQLESAVVQPLIDQSLHLRLGYVILGDQTEGGE